jgi:AsmA protein
MEASLAEAQAYKGTVKLRAVETTEPPNIDLKVNGSFSQIDINSFLQAAADTAWLSGSATGQFSLQSIGSTPAAVMGSLEGHGEITVDQGEIEGINIEQALRRVEKRPLLSASDVHYGRTSFDRAHATVDVSQGIAQIGNGMVGGPAAQVSFVGTASVADRTLLVRARASQTGPDGATRPGGPELSLTASGTWDDIDVEPDAESLIRRSDAAAPLLGIRRDGVSLSPPIKGAPAGAIAPTLQ